ncbi:MAG: hypothetical protein WDM81_04850 [Rhizomicrobium sp.]
MSLAAALLLAACADGPVHKSSAEMTMDSETCRSAAAEQSSRAREDLRFSSGDVARTFDQRYRTCMTDRGYTLPQGVSPL